MGPERDCTTKVLVGSHKCLGTAIYYIKFYILSYETLFI